MRLVPLAVIAALATPVLASQEQIHHWKSVTLVAETTLFGDVEVKAAADGKGNVSTLAVTIKGHPPGSSPGATIAVPAKWLQTLPALRLASIEVRSERGYDPVPWLYLVFDVGFGKDRVHISIQGGKVKSAMITTAQPDGSTKHEERKGP